MGVLMWCWWVGYVALALVDDCLGVRQAGEVTLSSGNGCLVVSLICFYGIGVGCPRAFGLVFFLGRVLEGFLGD